MPREITADERYQGDWTYWAPGGTLHPTRHDAIGAAALYGRDAPAGFDVDATSAIRKVGAIQPYKCDLCHQGYDTAEEYRDHLAFYQQYADDHAEFDTDHPTPTEVVA